MFDERKVSFEVGEGLNVGIPRGIEFALEKMKVRVYSILEIAYCSYDYMT